MNKEKAIRLLHKYFHEGEISEEDLNALVEWLKDPEHKKTLNEQVELDYLLYGERGDFNTNNAYDKISDQLKLSEKKQSSWKSILKYAAILVIALGVGFYFLNLDIRNSIESNPTSITLELDEGNTKTLNQEGQEIIVNKKGQKIGIRNKNSLTYNQDSTVTELVYNTLYVPKGKTFELALSDGTKILLNADTKITYPINFLPGKEREIRLRGEAYFQVAKDSLRPFIAQTKNQSVQVYGTTFNIKAYPEDLFDETVLVEGSVGVSTSTSEVKITPGQRAVTLKGEDPKVGDVNVAVYTTWVQGGMTFQADRFDKIIKVLERRFDVKIVNKYEKLNQERFTASFKAPKSAEQVLSLFAKSRAFEIKKKGNQITIYKVNKSKE